MSCVVNLHHLTFRYPGNQADTLKDLSLCLRKGEAVALLGRNGSGKSTLMNMLAHPRLMPKGHHITPNAHEVTLFSQQVEQDLFTDLTVSENLQLFGLNVASPTMCQDYLASYHPQLPQRLNVPVKMLSGGEKQAFLLSLTLYHTPSLVLMDEPTSAMDTWTRDKLMKLTIQHMAKTQATLLICTHSLTIAHRYTKRLIALNQGRIVLDRPSSPPLTLKEMEMIYA